MKSTDPVPTVAEMFETMERIKAELPKAPTRIRMNPDYFAALIQLAEIRTANPFTPFSGLKIVIDPTVETFKEEFE